MRGYRIRFEGNPGNKPEILGMERAFRKKILQTYGSEEFIDWNGDFHREYARQLRCPKGSCHYVALRVRGMAEGKYSTHVRVRVYEAPKAFEGKLTLDCLSQPNDWQNSIGLRNTSGNLSRPYKYHFAACRGIVVAAQS